VLRAAAAVIDVAGQPAVASSGLLVSPTPPSQVADPVICRRGEGLVRPRHGL